METISPENTSVAELRGLKSAIDGSYVNDAIAAITLLDKAGSEVGGTVWPIGMSYVSGSNGVYRAILPDDIEVESGERYLSRVVATLTDGSKATFNCGVHVTTRRCS
jgi:hypothetical protein